MAMTSKPVSRLQSFAPSVTLHARPLHLPTPCGRAIPKSNARITRLSPPARSFSQTVFHAQRPDRRNNADHVDYDASLGDPWLPYRLRTAKPLFAPPPPPPRADGSPNAEQNEQRRFGTLNNVLRTSGSRTFIGASIVLGTLFFWYNTEVVPVSGRTRFNCVSDNAMRISAEGRYGQVIDAVRRERNVFLPPHDPRARQVSRVLRRLIPVSGIPGVTEWAAHVIDSADPRTANAFVLANGKVFVYSAMLRVARTDDQVAAVLSHEMAHNLAKHHAERYSVGIGENFFLGSTFLLLLPLGWKYWLFGSVAVKEALTFIFSRPMNRMQETEADYIGLNMMAEACYDPRAAVETWVRMTRFCAQMGGRELPVWMSTHPSHEQRIERITKWLPEALDKRQKSDCRGTQGFADAFRRALDRNQILVRRV